jgi:MFS family permease
MIIFEDDNVFEKQEGNNLRHTFTASLKKNSPELIINLINFLLYFSIELSIIFLPLLGVQLGASDFQVGLIGTCYGAAFMLSSLFFGWRSDTLGRLPLIRYGALISSLAFLLQLLAGNVLLLMLARSFVGFAMGVVSAALVAFAYESVSHLGKFSSYGALGWIAGSMTAGIVKDFNYLFFLSGILCLAAFLASFWLKEELGQRKKAPDFFGIVRRNFRIYLAIFLRHLGATAVWLIMPLYLVSIGADRYWIGLLWSVNFGAQFIAMRYVEKFNENKVFALGQILSILVFLAYGFSNNYRHLIAVQVALGISWSCLYVGALLIVLGSGEDKGTASGIFQSTINLCNALGPFIGGVIAQGIGYKGVMFFAAFITVASFLAALPKPGKVSNETIP